MTTHLSEAVALAIFRAEEENPTAEFDTDEQWEKRISIFDSQPNPREDYLRYADAVLAITEADKAAAMQPLFELAASHERYADACEADAHDRWTGSHWNQEAHKARDEAQRIRWAVARGLAAEAGITVDANTEETP